MNSMPGGSPPSPLIAGLKASPFFGGLPEHALQFLSSKAVSREYAGGEMVFQEGDPSQGLFWLQEGALKAVKYSTSGREQVLHWIEAGQTFNEVGAFTRLPNPVSVVALTEAQVRQVPGAAIRRLIREDPDFAQAIIETLAQRLRSSVELIEDLSLRPVIDRLSRLILNESRGGTLFRPAWYTQEELAARLGTVADVVQRALRRLESAGLIEVERRQISILDAEGLQEWGNT